MAKIALVTSKHSCQPEIESARSPSLQIRERAIRHVGPARQPAGSRVIDQRWRKGSTDPVGNEASNRIWRQNRVASTGQDKFYEYGEPAKSRRSVRAGKQTAGRRFVGNGSHRRVTKLTGSTTRHYYYSDQWQVLEERLDSATTADRRYVWGIKGIDDLILRDRIDGGTERLYVLSDGMSVTAVVNTSGTVQERYGYTGFGVPRYMTASFGSRSSSDFDWETLFHAYRRDSETGFYQVRYRYLHPNLGRWLNRDPIGEQGGLNLYGMVGNDPVNFWDFLGLNPCCPNGEKIDCAALWDRVSLLFNQFNTASDALRNDLQYQFDSELTLFGIDRAIDTTATIVGAGVGSAVNAARAASGAARGSSSLAGQLSQSGQLSHAGSTLVGEAIQLGARVAPGMAVGVVTREGLRRPPRWGTNALRADIQSNIDSLDEFVQNLSDMLNESRSLYRQCCQ